MGHVTVGLTAAVLDSRSWRKRWGCEWGVRGQRSAAWLEFKPSDSSSELILTRVHSDLMEPRVVGSALMIDLCGLVLFQTSREKRETSQTNQTFFLLYEFFYFSFFH